MKKYLLFMAFASALLCFSGKKDNSYKSFDLKTFEKSLCYIPPGSFGFSLKENEKPYNVTLQPFYMYATEVSNGQYLEYVNDLLKQGKKDEYTKALPDSALWKNKMAYCEPYVTYYFRHPAYSNYPVVGITHEQAENFCKWLTEKYMKEEKRENKKVVIKLPSRHQWYYAATGGWDGGYHFYPWGDVYDRETNGNFRANFRPIPNRAIMMDSSGNYIVNQDQLGYYKTKPNPQNKVDAVDITAPVISYSPNSYGLYNMGGNVEEFISEKGKTKGGSWYDTGYYMINSVEQDYDINNSASIERGFRFVMEIIN